MRQFCYRICKTKLYGRSINEQQHRSTCNMLLWKRLCRTQGEPAAAATNSLAQRTALPIGTRERRFFGILRAGKRKNAASVPPTYRQHAAEHAAAAAPHSTRSLDQSQSQSQSQLQSQPTHAQAQQNDYVLEETNRRLRQPPPPPPPFYCPLPLTPPPGYTERAAPPPPAPQPAAEHAAAAAAAARQQARRRRRLRELQQQQQQLQQRFATSTSSSSSSSEQSSASDDGELGSAVRRQRRRRRSSRGLRDAYCPDLLHACALILHHQQQQQHHQPGSSDSSVGNFTATPPPPPPPPPSLPPNRQSSGVEYSSDYVEIDELALPPLGAARAKSTPQLQHAVGLDRLEMGQNLSLRRPRISLTWVLREQHQSPSQPQTQSQPPANEPPEAETAKEKQVEKQPLSNGHVPAAGDVSNSLPPQRTEPVPTQLDVGKKRYRVKQLPGSGTEPLTGYATTPTAHQAPGNGQLASQKFFSNQNLLEYKDKGTRSAPLGAPVAAATTKELLFVCTPQRAPRSDVHHEALLLARKRNEIRKKLASRLQQARAAGVGAPAASPATTTTTTTADALKCTYSEPSLVAVSEGGGAGALGAQQPPRRHRHRKRRERERNRVQRFGYEIHNVDEFLSRCSLSAPGNIPVVLATASTLYQTRPGGYQLEIPLPLGMVVNAVFKNQNWLYVQTPHAEEGYVGYASCLPLGILPTGGGSSSKPTPCWESNADIFPRPCGNMTDSEKEIRLRGGTRSDGARTPRSAKPGGGAAAAEEHNNNNNTSKSLVSHGGSLAGSLYGEQHVDKLYLRAASQPKLVEKAYAQLRSTKQLGSGSASVRSASNDEYVTLQQQQQQRMTRQKHLHAQQQSQPVRRLSNVSYITNGHNGQHLHPKSTPLQQSQQQIPQQTPHQAPPAAGAMLSVLRRQQQNGLRQTLVAINADFITESIVVHKGEIVTLCECRESKDQRQWFYVKTRDGREGFIPAEVAGHGYL
ncbi:uncharacterized protein LOC115762721 isoform X1 [Drosophila novamexicana]|uniref:uncharacterized protein LOC115762721 isoform X1 n=2 Tax=Drosophila novamexicana TaxID=47314 RepID=UPI0011E59A9F|nr:uncharacterized protein LOC115762721 isoform X1 [Drosophila novamexicana]